MGKKIRGVKLKVNDINKNTSKDISHTISKIQANERKYTFILAVVFLLIFCLIGFLSLRFNSEELVNYSDSISIASLSSSSKVVFLTNNNKLSDSAGLRSEACKINFFNNTMDDLNYKIVFVEDYDAKKKCGCFDSNFNLMDIKYSLDGKNIRSFSNNDGVITTGFLNPGQMDTIKLRIWISDKSINNGHIHGYFQIKKIDD